jgi:hypothetical protein
MADNARAELLGLAREHVGTTFGLTPEQSARLRGGTKAEIEADAKTMCRELGIKVDDDGHEQQRERDESGRFRAKSGEAESAAMNKLIRQAAGRA